VIDSPPNSQGKSPASKVFDNVELISATRAALLKPLMMPTNSTPTIVSQQELHKKQYKIFSFKLAHTIQCVGQILYRASGLKAKVVPVIRRLKALLTSSSQD